MQGKDFKPTYAVRNFRFVNQVPLLTIVKPSINIPEKNQRTWNTKAQGVSLSGPKFHGIIQLQEEYHTQKIKASEYLKWSQAFLPHSEI